MKLGPGPGEGAVADAAESVLSHFPSRWGVCLAATVSLPLVLLFIDPIAPQNGWWWDILMGAGMLAAGLMIAVPLISPRVWVHFGGDARALRFVLYVHRDVSYVVVLLTAMHIVGLLLVETLLVEYLKLSAPWSMLAALVSALLLLILVVSSLYRIELDLRYRSWRMWHIGLSVMAMLLMVVHVLDAGFYVNSPLKKAVFVVLAAGPSLAAFGAGGWHYLTRAAAHGRRTISKAPILRVPGARAFSARLVVLLSILWLISIMVFAIPKPDSRAEQQAHPCPESVCG